MEFDATSLEIEIREHALGDSTLTITDQFLHRTMKADPSVDGFRKSVFNLVRNFMSLMPTSASINHVKNRVFRMKDEIDFNWSLKLSAKLTFMAFEGPGLCHSLQTEQL